jgi:hypothetical protein
MKMLSTPPKVLHTTTAITALLLAAPPALADGALGALAPILWAQLAIYVFLVGLGIAAVAVVARALLPDSGTTSRTLSLFVCPVAAFASGVSLLGAADAMLSLLANSEPEMTGLILEGAVPGLFGRVALLAFSVWALVRILRANRRRRPREAPIDVRLGGG